MSPLHDSDLHVLAAKASTSHTTQCCVLRHVMWTMQAQPKHRVEKRLTIDKTLANKTLHGEFLCNKYGLQANNYYYR